MISPQSVVGYGLWMVLALDQINIFTTRCWCTDCQYLSTLIQSNFDPKVLAVILEVVVSIAEDKNLDSLLYGGWLTRVNSFSRDIQYLLDILGHSRYPVESADLALMEEVARAQIRQLIKWLAERDGISSSREVNETCKRIISSLAEVMSMFL